MGLNCIAKSALTNWIPLKAPKFTLMSPKFLQEMTKDAPGNKGIQKDFLIINLKRDFFFFQRCGGAVYEAEKVTIKDDPYHKKCLSCNKCGRQLDSLSLSIAPDNNVYCKVSTLFENHTSQQGALF